jgi:hypothetical protein
MNASRGTRRLRLLAEVADGKIWRTWYGWSIAGVPSTAAESRVLRGFREQNLIEPASSRALLELETEPVTITAAGLKEIAATWPEWKPQSLSSVTSTSTVTAPKSSPHPE